jgi:hypothetical protein
MFQCIKSPQIHICLKVLPNFKKIGFHKQQWIWWPQHVFHAQKACLVLKFGPITPPTPQLAVGGGGSHPLPTGWNDDSGSRNPKSCQKAFCYTSWTTLVSNTKWFFFFFEKIMNVLKIKFFWKSPCLWSLVWPFNPLFHPQFEYSCRALCVMLGSLLFHGTQYQFRR